MSTVKFEELPIAVQADLGDFYCVSQAGTSKQVFGAQIAELVFSTANKSTTGLDWSGPITTQPFNITYAKFGSTVTINLPNISSAQIALGGYLVSTPIPSILHPSAPVHFTVHVTDGLTTSFGIGVISLGGTISIGKTAGNLPFSGVSTMSIGPTTMTYIV
jgi:hypothetical protein